MYLSLKVHDALVPLGDDADRLAYAKQIVKAEGAALDLVAQRLDEAFLQVVDLMFNCTGRIGITGIGKSADVGQKIVGTLNSTGTRAFVLDATRALHGDLGMVHDDDVILLLSHSGESEEIIRLLGPLRELASHLVAITSNRFSTLVRKCDHALILGPIEEVCPLGLAPSTSTTAMIAVGDALAFVLSRMRNFTHEDFARYHPAGSLGKKLMKVDTVMRMGPELRVAQSRETVREVFARVRLQGRRTGAVMLTDVDGRLCGLFTDSDLARLFEERRDNQVDRPIEEVMTANPITVTVGAKLVDAVEIMRHKKISELPVVDEMNRPMGLVDITDVLTLFPAEETEWLTRVA